MNTVQRRTLSLWLISAILLPAASIGAPPMTWEEHREAAHAQLRYQLADPVSASQHLERALALAREQKEGPVIIGDLMNRLADAYNAEDNGNDRQEVTRYQTAVLDTLRYKETTLGEYAPELVPALKKLSSIRLVQERNLEAFELLARALTILIRHHGRDSAEVADGYVYLGNSYTFIGDRQQAEQSLRKAVDILRRLPDPPAEIYSGAFACLAELLRTSGRQEESAALISEYMPIAKRLGAKDQEAADQEAKVYEHLPRKMYSDVIPLTSEEIAARVAAGWATVEPAKPPPP